MNCPVCKNNPMITLELNEVEVDHCIECKGIWLDEGEMEMLLDTPEQAKALLNSFVIDKLTVEEKRKCPICNKKMDKISVGDQQAKIIIDKCKNQHGLWFDKNELPVILEHANIDTEHKVQKLLKEIFAQNLNDS